MKIFEKKTRHHYVWAHYLRDWTLDGTNIHYITKRDNVACDSVRGLGFEKDFYKMGMLREEDKEIILMMTKNCHDTLKKLHWDFAEMIFNAQKLFSKMSPEIFDKFGVDFNELMSSNLFENYLSQQESSAIDILNHLRAGNLAHLEDNSIYYDFCYFLGYQCTRTIKMKKLLTLSLYANESPIDVRKRLEDFYERNWWFMCSFMATNLSYDMSLNSNRKVILINNNTNIDFITSDQPVINLNPEGHTGEYIDYYYPLSTRRALLILTSDNLYLDPHELCNEDVIMLNSKIAYHSGNTIFGSSNEALLTHMKDFKSRHYLQFTN
ncbi:Uncharacterised protein [Yersinia thracica]|uniref:DUF4238 domain-containing protein n=1 Tax=Yersinia thracica TaxID=2890319 RepID=A0A0T9QEV1_9GAMM|nr:DUF4238 domain-containing protein [Yersinia thracica]EKN4025840.1 DUF4238 domain-containing protein [Yersinia enterocolitica]EKN5996044.1 DUF4238 domain-containing protein [Yersinia enterocolitica]CNI08286.1 Uncharacterised protein [Yersinia thracica]HEN3291342.1 DUF4238 domain-containing protein [Yersinia enterocolitica]